MIYAFFELAARVEKVRLHILGGVDDEEYAEECYALVEQLQLKNLIFTGRVDIVKYMEKLDFTILTLSLIHILIISVVPLMPRWFTAGS